MNHSGAWSSPGWRHSSTAATGRVKMQICILIGRRSRRGSTYPRARRRRGDRCGIMRRPNSSAPLSRGEIKVSVAAGLAAASKAVQRQAVADPDRAHVLAKQQRRRIRELELAGEATGVGRARDFRRDLRRPAVAVRTVLARDRARSRRRQSLFDDALGRDQGARRPVHRRRRLRAVPVGDRADARLKRTK